MKRFISLFLTFMMIFALAACGGGSSDGGSGSDDGGAADAAGTYKCHQIKLVGDSDWTEEDSTLTLNADGTGKHARDNNEFNVTWKLDGENFSMEETFIGDPIVYTGTLKDGKLDIFNGDPEDIWTYEYLYEKE
ncbi:MAG: hypothetical protein IJM62_02165 [Lachnospiraceae bacterium]|nr:hypothetical protein [Lachnospiraceae bacterium]